MAFVAAELEPADTPDRPGMSTKSGLATGSRSVLERGRYPPVAGALGRGPSSGEAERMLLSFERPARGDPARQPPPLSLKTAQ